MESELKALRKLKREMIMQRKKLDMEIAEVNMSIGYKVEEIEIAEEAAEKEAYASGQKQAHVWHQRKTAG